MSRRKLVEGRRNIAIAIFTKIQDALDVCSPGEYGQFGQMIADIDELAEKVSKKELTEEVGEKMQREIMKKYISFQYSVPNDKGLELGNKFKVVSERPDHENFNDGMIDLLGKELTVYETHKDGVFVEENCYFINNEFVED